MTVRCMVDIETLGIEPGAAILSIGAVVWTGDELGAQFYEEVALESCQANGLKVDADTLEWWLEQEEMQREILTGGEPLANVMREFRSFVRDIEPDQIWANSPKFDCAHLEVAFEAVDVEVPWDFYELRDYRTLLDVVDVDPDEPMQEHHALADAKHQARWAQNALKELGVPTDE